MKKRQTLTKKKTILGFILAMLLLLAGSILFSACSFTSPTDTISIVEETIPFIPVEAGNFDFSTIRIAIKKKDGSVTEKKADEMMLSTSDRAKLNVVGTHCLEIRYDGQKTDLILSVYPRGQEPSYTLRFFVLPQGVPSGSLIPIASYTQLISEPFSTSKIPAIPSVTGYTVEGWTVTDFFRLRVDTDIFAGYTPSEHKLSFSYICENPGCQDNCVQNPDDGLWWATTKETTRFFGDSIGAIPVAGIERNKPFYRLKGWVDQGGNPSKLYTSTSLFDKNGDMVLRAEYEPILIEKLELVTLNKSGMGEEPSGLNLNWPSADFYSRPYLDYLKKNFTGIPYTTWQFEEERTKYNHFNSFGDGSGKIYIKAYREYETEYEDFFYIPVDSVASARGLSVTHEGTDPVTGKKISVTVETSSAAPPPSGNGKGTSIFELSAVQDGNSPYGGWTTGETSRNLAFRYYVKEEERTIGNVTSYQPEVKVAYSYTLYRIFNVEMTYVDSSDNAKGRFDFGWGGVNPHTETNTKIWQYEKITELNFDYRTPQQSLWIFVYIPIEYNRYQPSITCTPKTGQGNWAGVSSYVETYDEFNRVTVWAIEVYRMNNNQPIGEMTFTVAFVER